MPDAAQQQQLERVFFARPLPAPWMAAALFGIILLSIYLYRRSWGLHSGLRFGLALARIVVLSLAAAALCEPMAVWISAVKTQRRLPVLIDVSESMSMKDQRKSSQHVLDAAMALDLLQADEEGNAVGAADQAIQQLTVKQRQAIANASRLDLALNLLTGAGKSPLQTLGQNLDVSYHAFGKTTRMLSEESVLSDDTASALAAAEAETSISMCLKSVANRGSSPVAGIVLLTDGIDNEKTRQSEAILRDLGARGIPVYTVPIGLTQPDDVSLRNVVMQDVAYSGDRVPVRIQIQSRGYEKRSASLVVRLNGRQVAQRNIRLDGGLQFEDIDFRVDVYEKGAAEVVVAIEPFADEVSTENNRVSRGIRIVNEKINVLYIEGNARWEYRYLRAILKRDPRINATFIASNVGPEVARNSSEHIERFPNDRETAFQYDLVVLGDVNASFFRDEELSLLEEMVRDRGASLLMLCGPMHSPTSYADTAVARMLPVRFDSDSPWEEMGESVYPVLTAEGSGSLVMNLENDADANDQIWSRVAPLDHLPPLAGAKPGATVLAELSESGSQGNRYPLVAWQRYGSGKCMSMATDRLWRLRFKTGDKYHWRVWSQCIQFMTLSRLMGEHKRIRIETDRASYPVDSQCRVHAHVVDDDYAPVLQPHFDVVVTELPLRESDSAEPSDPGEPTAALGVTIRLIPDRTHPGMYEGYFVPTTPGRYHVEANESDRPLANSTEFQVATITRELTDPDVRLGSLQRMSKITGGECLDVGDFCSLDKLVNTEPITTTVRSERPLWDNGWAAFLLIGLVGFEWVLRRKNDLP